MARTLLFIDDAPDINSLLVNYFSTPPVGDLAIHDPQDLFSLAVFVGVSVAVAGVVDRSARRSKEAARARAEAATLGELARAATRAEDTVGSLLEQTGKSERRCFR